jgi:hypothetical protein
VNVPIELIAFTIDYVVVQNSRPVAEPPHDHQQIECSTQHHKAGKNALLWMVVLNVFETCKASATAERDRSKNGLRYGDGKQSKVPESRSQTNNKRALPIHGSKVGKEERQPKCRILPLVSNSKKKKTERIT